MIDYYTWSLLNAPYNPLETYSITFPNLRRCIESQNLTFQRGDILFIRSGFIDAYSALDISAKESIANVNPPHFAGVAQSEEILEWIWNEQFAAVAGDAPAFEAWRTTFI